MNELVYRNLSEDAKRQICAWKYGGEYDLYNLPAYEEMQVRQIGFMNPQREKNYYGFWDESICLIVIQDSIPAILDKCKS